MNDHGILLGFYANQDDARDALRKLRRRGFRRGAMIARSADGDLYVRSISRRRRALWGAVGAAVGGLLGLLAVLLGGYLAAPLIAIVVLSAPAAIGGILGWVYARWPGTGVDHELMDRQTSWLLPEESVVVLQAPLGSMRTAVRTMRRIGDRLPSIFLIHPERPYEAEEGRVVKVPLPSAQIQRHAQHLAAEHRVEMDTSQDEPLLRRLDHSEEVIDLVCEDLSHITRLEQSVSPSAEWILDNSYIVRGHINDVRTNLPSKFYHELPMLATDPHRGEPRVYGLAVELIQHTDARINRQNITDFLTAYQEVAALTIGELWAMPLIIRIALVENLRRLSVQVGSELRERQLANFWANRLLVTARREPNQLFAILAELAKEVPEPSPYFAAQLTGHLYDEEAALVPVQSWLERSLRAPLSELILKEQTRQAADQVSIGNAITSLRQLSLLDWREIFEDQNRVERLLSQDPAGVYAIMDFDTRDSYRRAVEEIARRSKVPEEDVAEAALEMAAAGESRAAEDPRQNHVGTYLRGAGRARLMERLGGKETPRYRALHWVYRHHTALYLSAIALATVLLVALVVGLGLAASSAPPWILPLAILLSALPASQLAIQLINYLVTRLLPPRTLPKMDFEKEGIPDRFRTLVVVPVLMVDPATIRDEVEKLEIRYLANKEKNLQFGLFTDYADAPRQQMENDEPLLRLAMEEVEALNRRYGANRFYLFHRGREWCETERKFLGWERKRGKLEELNALLDGQPARGEEGIVFVGDKHALTDVRFVITLDSDTQLPRDSARRMIETLAHPLNQPRLRANGASPSDSYTIVQPRVSTALPSATATTFSRIFTDPVGTDPYTKAVSDVYQDLAGEASYIGKGIYDPRAFYRLLSDRFPEQWLLSHDLIEGAYVRVGLASDVELFDEFPSDYMTYARREHRWIRGDWQIMDWILPSVPKPGGGRAPNPLSILNRWKIFDNLRRSLVPAGSVLLLVLAWLISPLFGAVASATIGLLLLFQPIVQPVTWATTEHGSGEFSWQEVAHALVRSVIEASLLPHQAGIALDAILRVGYRRLVSRRGMLEWTTAQMAGMTASGQMRSFLINMAPISPFALLIGFAVLRVAPTSLYFAAPFLLLWLFSPLVAWRLNLPARPEPKRTQISSGQLSSLRRMARKTWRYFDDFVTAETNWLPPDNYQVSHQDQLAYRTSPTNIGLWMLSALAAQDFGYLTPDGVIERLRHTFETLDKLERFEGHLLNWYDLGTLAPLEPRYVSSVDSGNLLGSLWTLNPGVSEMLENPLLGPTALQGLQDTIGVLGETLRAGARVDPDLEALEALEKLFKSPPESSSELLERLRKAVPPIGDLLRSFQAVRAPDNEPLYWAQQIRSQIDAWNQLVDRYLVWLEQLTDPPPEFFSAFDEGLIEARQKVLSSAPSMQDLAKGRVAFLKKLREAREQIRDLPEPLARWLESLLQAYDRSRKAASDAVAEAEALLQASQELGDAIRMQFLYDRERRLFAIGFNVNEGRPDGSHYDLLASEARIGSFVSIARGEIPSEHWLAMNRPYGTVGSRRVLLSWTGTMFEYLMPSLLQRTFDNSLLDKATREAVALHQEYARRRGVPWGISESAYGDLDPNKTYQYKAFGVPGLGLKRGLEEDLVVAPYATMLALPVDPAASMENLDRLAEMGLYDTHGFFESIDFSRQRRREGERGVIVRAYMAHHQAMSFLAMDNFVNEHPMQRRFHSDPRVRATEPLLYERIPVSPPLYHISTRERPPSRITEAEIAPSVSRFDTPYTATPKTQLLSNGSYVLMVTSAGGGFSQWRDFEITRWRADTTRDHWGTFCYIRDLDNGHFWSNTFQPAGGEVDRYEVNFAVDRAEIRRHDAGIETETEIIVSPEDDVEIRRITLINRSLRTRDLEITTYAEMAMAPHSADRQHPAFNKLFIQTEWLPDQGALLAFRRPREEDDPPIFVTHQLTMDEVPEGGVEFETDRERFIGRGRSTANPAALNGSLSNTEGYVLDPILSLRRIFSLRPGQRVQFSLVLGAAETREGALAQVEKYADSNVIGRALELAWAYSQLELRQLRIQPDEARRFQQLASFLLYPSARLRPPQERLAQNRLGQSGLWPYGISGDLPLAVVSIGEARDIGLVRQMLQAHTYWRQHGLKADLLILNEESSSYDQPLNEQLERLILGHSMYTGVDQPGGVFLRNVDQIPEDDLTLMLAVARVALVAARGSLPQQLSAPSDVEELPEELPVRRVSEEPSSPLPYMELSYYNGLGGFTPDGREYAIYLGPDRQTPVPWVNVIANGDFGALVTETGSGFAWYGNSQRNRLNGWSNDPVSDLPSEAVYIRDEESGEFWTPTPLPIREREAYRIRHGAGYSIFEHNSHAIEQELIVSVPIDETGGDPVRVQRLRLRNDSPKPRKLSVTFYLEWTLGEDHETSQMHVVTHWDSDLKTLLARNRYHPEYGDRIAFATLSPAPQEYTADRAEFLGRNGSLAHPVALRRIGLGGRTGAGLDPCSALQVSFELEPGEDADVTCLLGQAESLDEVQHLVQKYREDLAVEDCMVRTSTWWNRLLDSVQVETPELSVDLLLNRWLLYQSLSCRIWGRSGFYQSGGAFGFRDQLQDVMSLLYGYPEHARDHILLAASRQFREGDVQHWWHPPSGAGIRSRISDDLLWLPYVVAQYVEVTGDEGILEENVPFLDAPLLEEDQHEVYLVPEATVERASLYEHCRRAIERGLTAGPHGLPLIGIGDWNDGMNRVGVEGKGESVWLAWFLVSVLKRFARVAERCGQPDHAEEYREKAKTLAATIEREAWDGAWYRRAIFDDGSPLGSAANEEARIDSLAQSWAWISGTAIQERAERALDAAWEHLVRADDRLVLLFTPPFDQSEPSPGYIQGYPPGVRENGGQYTHGALWLPMAFVRRGDGDRAAQLLRLLNPIEHARELEGAMRYAVEPYVVAADVYSLPGKVGRGGWTWYTGSAGWMYRVWLEEVLGLKVRGDTLTVEPMIPSDWDRYSIRLRQGEAVYEIQVENPEGVTSGVAWVEMDGRRLDELEIPLENHSVKHKVRVLMGAREEKIQKTPIVSPP